MYEGVPTVYSRLLLVISERLFYKLPACFYIHYSIKKFIQNINIKFEELSYSIYIVIMYYSFARGIGKGKVDGKDKLASYIRFTYLSIR